MPALGLTIIDLQLPACFPPPSCQFRKRYRNDFLALDFEKQLPVFRVSKLETEFAERTGIRLRRDTFSAEQKNTKILNPLIGLVGVEDLAHHQYGASAFCPKSRHTSRTPNASFARCTPLSLGRYFFSLRPTSITERHLS